MRSEDRKDARSMQLEQTRGEQLSLREEGIRVCWGTQVEDEVSKRGVKKTGAIGTCFIILFPASCCVNITFQSPTQLSPLRKDISQAALSGS